MFPSEIHCFLGLQPFNHHDHTGSSQVQLLRQQLAELRRLLDEQQLEKADMEDQMRRLQEDIPLAVFRSFCIKLLTILLERRPIGPSYHNSNRI